MNIKNKGTGAGGARTNLHGLRFEENTYMQDWLTQVPNISLEQALPENNRSKFFRIYDQQKKLIAYYGRQGSFYLALKEFLGECFSNEYINDVLSSKMNPDSFILNCRTKTAHIFEKKWQQSSGSVDEKIQTAPFKVAMFEKLLRQFQVKVTYDYILSGYFANKKFRDIKNYYQQNYPNIRIYVENENLNNLSVKDYLAEN